MLYERRPYQEIAISKVATAFLGGHRSCLLISPTASGKTVMFAKTCRALNKIMNHKKGRSLRVGVIAHTRELLVQIEKTMKGFNIDNICIFATNRTAKKFFDDEKLDLIFVDEAHRIMTKTYQHILAKHPSSWVLGATATPFRMDGVSLMKNEGGFFEVAVRAEKFKNLAPKYIVLPQFYKADKESIPSVADLGVNENGEYKNLQEVSNRYNKPKLLGEIVKTYLFVKKQHKIFKALVFAINHTHAEALKQKFLSNGISARCISGRFHKERNQNLKDFVGDNNKFEILINVNICTEGWDDPKLPCVIVARPVGSYILFTQIVGRAVRKIAGKNECVIIDHGGCYDNFGSPIEELFTPDMRKLAESNGINREKCCPLCSRVQPVGVAVCSNDTCGYVFRAETAMDESTDPMVFITSDGRSLTLGSSEWKSYLLTKVRSWSVQQL